MFDTLRLTPSHEARPCWSPVHCWPRCRKLRWGNERRRTIHAVSLLQLCYEAMMVGIQIWSCIWAPLDHLLLRTFRGLNLYSRGPGPQNSPFCGVRILHSWFFICTQCSALSGLVLRYTLTGDGGQVVKRLAGSRDFAVCHFFSLIEMVPI